MGNGWKWVFKIGIKNNYLCSYQLFDAMEYQFSEMVEKIYNLPLQDKMELKNLLEHNIAEERRNEIDVNYKKSKQEHNSGNLHFTSNINDLKKML